MFLIFLVFWLDTYNPISDNIYNKDQNQVINQDAIKWDPIRQWTKEIVEKIDIYKKETNNSIQARQNTIDYISSIVNYFLSLLALFSLIYLLRGFLSMITAAWDEAKFKKWYENLKIATLAIIWIWISFILIRFIFYIVRIWTG